MFSVNQPWDKLKVCAVGTSYPPEFYSFVKNPRVRNVLEKVAFETEEDYQKLVKLLESFNVKVIRSSVNDNYDSYLKDNKYIKPPMTPRDHMIMIGDSFCIDSSEQNRGYDKIINSVKAQKNPILFNKHVNGATTIRLGKDLFIGTMPYNKPNDYDYLKDVFPTYRQTIVDVEGHHDGVFCPVVPGLIVSLNDIQDYKVNFPDWEVVYLPNQYFDNSSNFHKIKNKNGGKWWIPGEEDNDDLIDFISNNFDHWLGFAEETVFEIGMLVVDQHNVICNNYNDKIFNVFKR